MVIGIPPFYDKDPNKMYMNIEKAPIRWPSLEGQGISVSLETKDLIMKVSNVK